jgi:hypothetical protein
VRGALRCAARRTRRVACRGVRAHAQPGWPGAARPERHTLPRRGATRSRPGSPLPLSVPSRNGNARAQAAAAEREGDAAARH